jgi:eukaryotic-like serine/threonine-protein kinase
VTLAPGTVLADRYRLDTRIAVGGMGEVWRAQDIVLGRHVAVKALKEEYAADPTFVARFRAEARHTAALSHPGIANVFDYGEAGDQAYLVMELVDGEPLSAILARDGRLTVVSALDVVGQTGLALQTAHDAGVVHRDIKPGNLLIRPDGVVKVTDFGIARAVDASPVTQTGMVVGTAAYLSPEQASGRAVTPASDVYSLGVVAYECLSGERPFQADSAVGVAMAHATTAPPPLANDVPPLVADFVMRALEKEPARRQSSAGDFGRTALALAATMRGGGDAEGSGPSGTKVMTAAAPGPVATAAVGAGGTAAGYDEAQRRRVRNVLVAIGAVVVLAGFLLLRSCGPASTVVVPGVVGKGYSAAAALLDKSRLHVARHTVHDSTHPAGMVLRQSPRPRSKVDDGSTVTLTVASGPRTVTVDPSTLIGQPVADVTRRLRREGLVVSVVPTPSRLPAGTVTAVDPSGAMQEGSTVTVTVAAVPAPPAPRKPPKHGHEGKHGD